MNPTLYPLTLLYDAACPVCSLEMDHLRTRDRHGALRFVDVSVEGFDPAAYGSSLAALNAEIHAIRADGGVVRGVEVLRLAYDAVGLGWVLRATGWPALRPAFDIAYRVFARHRLPISRAVKPVISAIRSRRGRHAAARMRECAEGVCKAERESSRGSAS